MDELLKQINIIKSIFKKYYIEAAGIFGSRLFGTNNEFSDLDVVVIAEKFVISANKSSNLLKQLEKQHLTTEAYINTLLSPMIDEIKRRIMLDVNVIIEYDYNNFFHSPVYKNKIEIIKDNKVVKQSEVKKGIIAIRKNCCKKTIYAEGAQKYSLYMGIGYLAGCIRHYDSIKTEGKFLLPKHKWELTSRNTIITNISYFVQEVDKVDAKYFEMAGIDYLSTCNINKLVIRKKQEYRNYNTSALSWVKCPESIYTKDELKLFWVFLIQHIEISRKIMNDSVEPDYIHIKGQYEYFLEDKSGFRNAMTQEYIERMDDDAFVSHSKEHIDSVKKIYKNYKLLNKIIIPQKSLNLLSRSIEDYSSYLGYKSNDDVFADIIAAQLKNMGQYILYNFRKTNNGNCYIYLFEKEIEDTIECLVNIKEEKFSDNEFCELNEILQILLCARDLEVNSLVE